MDVIPLIQKLTILWSDSYELVRYFPKLDKHLFGQRLLNDCDEVIRAVLCAFTDAHGRTAHLIEASAAFDHCKLRIRIAVKRELISERWYASKLNDLMEIGKMIGGWKKRTQSRE